MGLRRWIRRLRRRLLATRLPQGERGVRLLGHRRYVGGRWDEIGALQLDFLRRHGLESSHVFLDIACGSLRGGVHFIGYLEPGHYLGVEKEERLVRLGLEEELSEGLADEKRPEIVVTGDFEFDRLSRVPHVSLAHSLFTHLEERDIRRCLRRLRSFVAEGHVLWATFFEGAPDANPEDSHDHGHFRYPRALLEAWGREEGWTPRYVGEWGHPRGQVMMRFEAS